MPRVRSQLALQLPPELIARVKAEAEARGQNITTLVRGWLEAALEAAPGPAAGGAALVELEARLAAVEARLAALAQPPAPRATPAAADPAGVLEILGTAHLRPPAPAAPPELTAAVATAALADRIGMKRGSLNEKIRRAGGARVGLVLHLGQSEWRCVGQGHAPGGGPPRWFWQPA